jgi:hypothetical protein
MITTLRTNFRDPVRQKMFGARLGGAFAVHGICGFFGTLSLGFFAVGNYGDVEGILHGGNADQLIAQVKGSAMIIACTAAAGLLLMFDIKAIGVLRISEAEELEGLDIAEHGAPAYHPEYASMGYSPIPSNLEGVAPGLSVGSAPPSDIHLPTSEESDGVRSAEPGSSWARLPRARG